MLRRMKDAARDGLPRKIIKAYKETMPAVQAKAYSGVLAKAGNSRGSRKLMLEILHHLRGVSLHPHRADDVDTSDRGSILSWIGASARLSKCVELLRGIAGRGDKAIVFVEDLAVQRAFAESMAVVFDLEDIPEVINGGLPGDKRQAIVDRFQEASLASTFCCCRRERLVLASRSLRPRTCSISADGGTRLSRISAMTEPIALARPRTLRFMSLLLSIPIMATSHST